MPTPLLPTSLLSLQVLFSEIDSPAELQAKVKAYAAEHPTGTIFGQNWGTAVFPPEGPNAKMLDEIIADRPVVLISWDLHAAWCNSLALKVAGITKETPDPAGGAFIRDAEGNPTGYLQEASAMIPVVLATNAITPEAVAKSAERVMFGLAMQGFTSAQDAGSGFAMIPGLTAARMMDAAGKLPIRIEASYICMPSDDAATAVKSLKEITARFGSPDVDAAPPPRSTSPMLTSWRLLVALRLPLQCAATITLTATSLASAAARSLAASSRSLPTVSPRPLPSPLIHPCSCSPF